MNESSFNPRVVLFDLYGTLIDIRTEERNPEVWDRLARFLRYRGLPATADDLHERFFALLRASHQQSAAPHPEFDAIDTFRRILHHLGYTGSDEFAVAVTQLFRTLTMRRFALFPDTLPGLLALRQHARLGLISDAQRCYLEPELHEVGLRSFFDTIVVSSDHGFRKPDPRLFHDALAALDATPEEACYIGDNVFRDVCGARNAGLTAILIQRGAAPLEAADCRPDHIVRDLHELVALLGR